MTPPTPPVKSPDENTDSEDEADDPDDLADETLTRAVSYGPSNGGGAGGGQDDRDGFMMWQTRRMDGTYLKLIQSSAVGNARPSRELLQIALEREGSKHRRRR